MVSRKFRRAYLQEVGLTQISGDHCFLNIFSTGHISGHISKHIPTPFTLCLRVRDGCKGHTLDESQGSSPLQGHGYWLVCELALRASEETEDSDESFGYIKNIYCLFYTLKYISLYSLIETFFCLKLINRPQQHGPVFGSSYLNHLDMSS